MANGDVPLMDISNLEEITGGPTLTVASLPYSNKIAFMEMSQRFHLDHLQKVLETALTGCKEIQNIFDKAVREHLAHVGSACDWGSISK